jgi:HSP20 family molecular chaperone IbpA
MSDKIDKELQPAISPFAAENEISDPTKEINTSCKDCVFSIKENDTDDKTLHRGISYRKFKKSFTLADDIVVNSAKLENGLLTIECEQIVPEEKKPRTIKVE